MIFSIQESDTLAFTKTEDLIGSLEPNELWIFERKGVQESVQALQAKNLKKNGGFERQKSMKIQEKFKKYAWASSQKINFDGKLESFKKGRGTSNLNQSKSQIKNKKHIQCYNFEKWGHYVSYYWYNKGKEKAQYNGDDEAKIV